MPRVIYEDELDDTCGNSLIGVKLKAALAEDRTRTIRLVVVGDNQVGKTIIVVRPDNPELKSTPPWSSTNDITLSSISDIIQEQLRDNPRKHHSDFESEQKKYPVAFWFRNQQWSTDRFINTFDEHEEHDWNCRCTHKPLIDQLFSLLDLLCMRQDYAMTLRDRMLARGARIYEKERARKRAERRRKQSRFIYCGNTEIRKITRLFTKSTIKPHTLVAQQRVRTLGYTIQPLDIFVRTFLPNIIVRRESHIHQP